MESSSGHPTHAKQYAVFLIIKKLTRFGGNWDEWSGKLLTLLGEFPNVDVTRMGFPDNWREYISS